MDYNDDVWGNNDWGGFQSGDTYVDDSGAKYIYTGTNWGQFDTAVWTPAALMSLVVATPMLAVLLLPSLMAT